MENREKEIVLSVPIKRAKFTVTSNWLERLDEFTKFVFHMLAKGHDEHGIQAVTRLQSHLIIEEVNRLINWGLVDKNHALTELGHMYGRLLSIIDFFNEADLTLYINLFNGHVLSKEPPLKQQAQGVKLKSNVTWVQTQSANFSNARTVFFSNHLFTHPNAYDLTKEAIESLEVRLVLCKDEPTSFYVKEVESLLQFQVTSQKEKKSDIAFLIEVPSLEITICHDELILHNAVLPTIAQIQQYDQGFLSQRAKQLLLLKMLYESTLKCKEQLLHWHPFKQQFQSTAMQEAVKERNIFVVKYKRLPPVALFIQESYADLPTGFYANGQLGVSSTYVAYMDSRYLMEEFI